MDTEVIERSLADHAKGIKEFKDTHAQEVKALKDENAETKSRLLELEQWATSRRGNGGGDTVEANPFEELFKHERMEGVRKGMPTTGRMEIKASLPAILKTLFTYGGGGESPDLGFPIQPTRAPGLYENVRRPLRLLDMLRRIPVPGSVYEYVQLDPDANENTADYQEIEGTEKAEGEIISGLQTSYVLPIANFVRASKQVLDDAAQLMGVIQDLLRYRVLEKLERELVNGNGVGKRIRGIATAATPYIAGASNAPDAIGEALATLDSNGWNGGLIILEPLTWHGIRSERATGDGQYIAGGWNAPGGANVWNTPVVTTSSLAAGKALILDPSAVAILDRMQATVMVSTEDADNFTKNLVTILAELRAGLAILNPSAIFSVDLPVVTG